MGNMLSGPARYGILPLRCDASPRDGIGDGYRDVVPRAEQGANGLIGIVQFDMMSGLSITLGSMDEHR